MPIDYSKYPPDWKTRIRPDILRRANNRCELCGVENGSLVWRERVVMRFNYGPLGRGGVQMGQYVKVVLTIAHLDHNIKNNDYSNLKALCQKCHLALDQEQHRRNAAAKRSKRRRDKEESNGQTFMDLD